MNIEIKPCIGCNKDLVQFLSLTVGDIKLDDSKFYQGFIVKENLAQCQTCGRTIKLKGEQNQLPINKFIEIWNYFNIKENLIKENLNDIKKLEIEIEKKNNNIKYIKSLEYDRL